MGKNLSKGEATTFVRDGIMRSGCEGSGLSWTFREAENDNLGVWISPGKRIGGYPPIPVSGTRGPGVSSSFQKRRV